MKQSFKSIPRKIKVFLHRQKWKETLIFLAFVLLAFGFWYLQSLQQDYEIEISIPVRYRNIPPEIAFTDSLPDRITARLRDKGSILLNYSFGRNFTPIEANLRDIPVDRGEIVIERKDIEADIYKQLLATTMLTSFEPTQLNITYSQRMEKEVPVAFNGNIQFSPGFHRSGETQLIPPTVTIYAAQSQLDTIAIARTVFTEIKNTNRNVSRNVQLQPIDGVTFSTDQVTVSVAVEQFTEKTLDVQVEVTNIPSDYTVRLFPALVKVNAGVPMSRFKDLTAEMFSIKIPFSELEQNLTGNTSIELTDQPDWIRSATLSPSKIEFILEQHIPQQ